ncbi:MAG TPA: DUF2156 domain-containing protein [Conexibacter sp.]|nr:DUF2156 domain-containing protein [Conexibacter sp.]
MTRLVETVAIPAHSDAALERLRRHGDHSSGILTLNAGMAHFTTPGVDGYVGYREAGRHHVLQLCGPVAPPADRSSLLAAFLDWAVASRRRVTAVQLTASDVALYVEQGFTVNQLGASYSIDLTNFTLAGTRFMKVRNKLQRARRAGVSIREWDVDEQREATGRRRLAEIDRSWLRAKGALAKELAFMVGERGGPADELRRLFVATVGERPIAYATYSPCYGARPGWLYDLTRRRPDAPTGTIELLFLTALERLRDEGCEWLHLGHTPMAQLDARHDPPSGSSRIFARLLGLIAKHGEAIYPARSQEQFKLKWAPHAIEPEYIGFAPRVSVGAIWQLLRLTRAI